MIVRTVRPALPRVALALALSLAIAALALGLRGTPASLAAFGALALGALALPWLDWPSPPAILARALPRLHGLVLLTVATVAWFSRSLALWDIPPAGLATLGGALVVPLALAFALAPRAFPPGRTLVPSTIYLLGLAGLDPRPAGYGVSRLPFLRGSEHSSFAELYLAIAVLALAALWASVLAESGPRWRWRDVAAQAVAAVVAVVLAATGVVGLPLLQPHLERAIVRALDQGQTGLRGESTLGEFAELAVSRRRVLDLEAGEASGPWLLRSEVFTAFDGRRWSAPALPQPGRRGRVLQPGAPVDGGPLLADVGAWFRIAEPRGATPGSAREQTRERAGAATPLRVNQHELADWPLLLPRGVSAVTTGESSLELDRFGNIRRPAGGIPVELYGAIVSPALADAAPLDADERAESLALPRVVDPRVRALARSLAPPGATERQRLEATVAHLHDAYRYTLRPGAFLTADPLAEFLFDKKAGYCEYFAAAGVVLLRLSGVPARFVKGLSVGPQTDQGGGVHVVRESDAHAWLEAWLPGEGWVEADPTPPGAFAAAHARPGAFERAFQRARAALGLRWAQLANRGPLAFLRAVASDLARLGGRLAGQPLSWLALLAFVAGPRVVRWWRARRRRRPAAPDDSAAVPSELRALVRDVERRWRVLGRPRPAGRGLLEHARALCAQDGSGAPLPGPAAHACREIVEAYYRARFGGLTPSPAELQRLQDAGGPW